MNAKTWSKQIRIGLAPTHDGQLPEHIGLHREFLRQLADFIDSQAEQIERMRWIPVGERLPEDMRRLWAYDGKYIYVARYDLDKKVFYNIEGSFTNDRFYHKILSGITHWMPVPDSPSSRPEGQDYGISK